MIDRFRNVEMRVDTAVLAENMRCFARQMEGKCDMMAVVKADAYGHGAVSAAKVFLANGAKALAVATVEEGIELREAGIRAPILILGGSSESGARACVQYTIAQSLFDLKTLAILQDEAKKRGTIAHAHLKIDTGMSRVGLNGKKELEEMLAALDDKKAVKVEGIFTHFADAEDDPEFTRLQDTRFKEAIGMVRQAGYRPFAHACASAAALKYPMLRYDMVRPGVVLYGSAVRYLCPGIEPAQTLVTKPVRVERLEKGTTIGYGRAFTCQRDSTIMTLPVGYGDGYPRILGGKAYVLVKGKRVPLVGRVCMDMMMADVTDVPGVTPEDEVVLLGAQGEERITPDELAALADTIPYEIMLGFHKRVPRKEC